MEDAHIAQFNIAPETHIFGVFDGPGGKEVARYVAKHYINELVESDLFKKGEYERALRASFLRMDERISTPEGKRELAFLREDGSRGDGGESQAGCTANVALIVKKVLYCANAGDSRCVLSSKGQAVEMSFDHKPDNEKEKDRVHKAGGYVTTDGRINGNLNLSRAIGDMEYKKNSSLGVEAQLITAVPDIEKRVLTADDDFIVVGCDGIWECKSNQAIVDFVGERLKLQPVTSRIVEDLLDNIVAPDTLSGYGCDNMTCVVVTLK